MKTDNTAQLVYGIAAWVAFMVFARAVHRWLQLRKRDPHSPIDARFVWNWIKVLVKGDPDPETATEPDTARRRGYRLRPIDENKTAVDRIEPGGDLPLAEPTGGGNAPNQLHVWIRRSFEEGARYRDVVRDGQTLFRVSAPTVKRAIARVRRPAR